MSKLCVLALLLVGCGSAPEIGLVTTVTMHGLLRDDVESLSFYVLSPRRTNDVVLSRAELMNRDIEPEDSTVTALGYAEVLLANAGNGVIIGDIEAGPDRLVYIEAYGPGAAGLVGQGCTEGIDIEGGKTTPVPVVIYPSSN